MTYTPRGLWQYAETDAADPFSALLNRQTDALETVLGRSAARTAVVEVPTSASGYVTAAFPAGRFTVPPAVSVQILSTTGSAVAVPWSSSTTSTGCSVRLFTLAGAGVAGVVRVIAIQQTPTSAVG